jgi:hypothetical protein
MADDITATPNTTTTTTTTTPQQSVHQQNPPRPVHVFYPSDSKTIAVPVCSYNGLRNAIQDIFSAENFSLCSAHQIYDNESLNKYWMYGGDDPVYVFLRTESQTNIQNQVNLPQDPNNSNRRGDPPATHPSQPPAPANSYSTHPSQPPPQPYSQNSLQSSYGVHHALIRAVDTLFHAFHSSLVSLQEGVSGTDTEGSVESEGCDDNDNTGKKNDCPY